MPYLAAAYAVAWLGIFLYLAFIVIRLRNVRTELLAVTEVVREQSERAASQQTSGGTHD
jgi:CcmD family protein